MKTVVFVLIVALVLLLMIAGGVFYFYIQSKGRLAMEKQAMSLLVAEPVISPILSFNSERVWYMTKEGRLFRKTITPSSSPPHEGEKREGVEEFPLPVAVASPTKVIWPKDRQDFIVEITAEGQTRYIFYDSLAATFVSYAPNIHEPVFVGGGERIVYDWVTAEGEHKLTIADPNSTNFQKVVDLPKQDYRLAPSSAKSEVVLFSDKLTAPSKLWLVDVKAAQFTELGLEASYQGVKFSPDGTKLLAAKISEDAAREPSLGVFDLTTSEFKALGLNSRIERVVWSKDSDAIMIGDLRGFQKYNLATGGSQTVYQFSTDENFSPRDLILHPSEPILFFVDEKTGFLYRLDLLS